MHPGFPERRPGFFIVIIMKNIIPVIIFLSLFLLIGSASSQFQLVVKIIDEWSGESIPGVMFIAGTDTSISDSTGLVRFTVKSDSIQITISRSGYFPQEISASLSSANPIIYLAPILNTDTVPVFGDRLKLSESDIGTGISRLDLKHFVRTGDAGAALALQEGVFVNNYGGQEATKSVGIRGLGSEQTLVLLDDIPLNRSQTGSVDLGRYASDYFSGAEIYRGGFSTLFGAGAIGGVINLNGGSGPGMIGMNLEKGAYGAEKLLTYVNFDLGSMKHSLKFRRNYSPNHYDFLLDDKTGVRQNSDFSKSGFQYRSGVTLSDRNEIGITALWNRFANGSPSAVTGSDQGSARLNEEDLLAGLRWVHRYPESTQIQSLIYVHRNWLEYNDPMIIHSRHFNQDAGFKVNQKTRFNNRLQLYTGVEGRHEKVESSETGLHQRWQVALLAMFNWNIWQQESFLSSLSLAAREEIFSYTSFQFLPRAGLEVVASSWRVYLSAGKNYRNPTLNEFFWQPGGNPDLNAESSLAYEVGGHYEPAFWSGTKLRVSLYQISVANMIRWAPESGGFWKPMNLDQVRSRGIELESSVVILNELLKGQLNYKYGLSIKTGSDAPNDKTVGNRLANIPSTELTTQIFIGPGSWQIGAELYFMSFRYTTIANIDDEYLPAATVVNVSGDYSLMVKPINMTIYGRLNNVFKSEYQYIKNYPVPVKEWVIGLKIALHQKDQPRTVN